LPQQTQEKAIAWVLYGTMYGADVTLRSNAPLTARWFFRIGILRVFFPPRRYRADARMQLTNGVLSIKSDNLGNCC